MKAIIFDFGSVLIRWDPRNVFNKYFPNQPQAMEDFLTETRFAEWNAQQDKGRSFAEGIELFTREFPQYTHLIRAFYENWNESITGEIPGTVEILQTLKRKKYPLYGLSNWSAETFPIAREQFPFLNLFDDVILSGEVKLIKPERAIFDLCLERINKPSHECIFIDDSQANIIAAKEIGFDAIHFTSPEKLKAEMQKRDILKEES